MALSLLAASACGETPTLREWQPTDHAQPAEANVDPARVAADAPSEPLPQGESLARAAAALYRMSCAPCHGMEGRGDGPAKPEGATIRSFADAAFQSSNTDEALAAVIADGRGLMPKFGTQINPDGIHALVVHIRSLGPGAAAKPESN
ncbi:MAG: cytochrome c [Polyangiales bacterium]